MPLNRDPERILSVLRQQVRDGRPCPGLLNLGPGEIPCDEILAASPSTKIKLRIYPGGASDFAMGFAQYHRENIAPVPSRSLAHFHLFNNEISDFSPAAIRWWLEQMRVAESLGCRIGVLCAPTGNPADQGVWRRPDVHDLLRQIRDRGHRLVLHEYDRGDGTWELGRFIVRVVYGTVDDPPDLPADLVKNMPKVSFSEWGIQGLRDYSRERLLAVFRIWNNFLAPFDFVEDADSWCDGDGGTPAYYGAEDWRGDNYDANVSVFAEI